MLQGFPAAEVGFFVRTKGTQKVAVKLAATIVDRFLKGLSVLEGYRIYLQVAKSIDEAKVRAIGLNASTNHSNWLVCHVAMQWASMLEASSQEITFLENEMNRLEKEGSWFYPKAANLLAMLNRKNLTRTFAHAFGLPKWVRWFVRDSYDSLTDEVIDGYIVELIQTMDQLRKYGIKPASYNDLYSAASKTKWVVHDPKDINRNTLWTGQGIGSFYLVDGDLGDYRVKSFNKEIGDYQIAGSNIDFGAHLTWTLTEDGHLDLSEGVGALPVKQFFDEAGSTAYYDALRLNAVMRIYDLVVPIEIANRVPSINRPKGFLGTLLTLNKFGNGLMDLIVPRLKSLQSIGKVEQELQREIETDISDTAMKRDVRQHEVVGFVRRIRKGYQAPESVVRLAWEESRIILREGETYVRRHTRGSAEKGTITGHRMKRKPRHRK